VDSTPSPNTTVNEGPLLVSLPSPTRDQEGAPPSSNETSVWQRFLGGTDTEGSGGTRGRKRKAPARRRNPPRQGEHPQHPRNDREEIPASMDTVRETIIATPGCTPSPTAPARRGRPRRTTEPYPTRPTIAEDPVLAQRREGLRIRELNEFLNHPSKGEVWWRVRCQQINSMTEEEIKAAEQRHSDLLAQRGTHAVADKVVEVTGTLLDLLFRGKGRIKEEFDKDIALKGEMRRSAEAIVPKMPAQIRVIGMAAGDVVKGKFSTSDRGQQDLTPSNSERSSTAPVSAPAPQRILSG